MLAIVPAGLWACDGKPPASKDEAPAKTAPAKADTPATKGPQEPSPGKETPPKPADEGEPTPPAKAAAVLPALPSGAPNLELVVMHEGELLSSQMKKLTKLHKRLEAELGATPLVFEPSVQSRPDVEPPAPPEGTRALTDARRNALERWLGGDAEVRAKMLADPAWTKDAVDPSAESGAGSTLVLWFTAPRELSSGKRRGKGVQVMALLRRDEAGLHEVMHSQVRGGGPGSPFPLKARGEGVPDFAETLVPLVNTRSP